MDEEYPVVARAVFLAPPIAGHDRLEQRGGGCVVAARFGHRHLEVLGLDVGGVEGEQLVGGGNGFVELPELAMAAAGHVESEPIARIVLEDGVGLGQSLLRPLGAQERLAQAEPNADAGGIELEGLAIVQDRLVDLLRARVDLAQDRISAGGRRLELKRFLQRPAARSDSPAASSWAPSCT